MTSIAMIYLIAFLSGLVYFFSVCLVSTFPVYASYLAGVSFKDSLGEKKKIASRRLILGSIFFILGATLVFLILGLAVSSFSIFLVKNRMIISRIGGLLLVLLGLYLIGGTWIPWLNREFKLNILNRLTRFHYLNSFLLGFAFSFAWSPCFSPIYASIFVMASLMSDIWQSLILLIIFSIGVATPFIIFSLTLKYSFSYLIRFKKYFYFAEKILGIIILVIGILILVGKWSLLVKN